MVLQVDIVNLIRLIITGYLFLKVVSMNTYTAVVVARLMGIRFIFQEVKYPEMLLAD